MVEQGDLFNIGKKVGKLEKKVEELKKLFGEGDFIIVTRVDNGYILYFSSYEDGGSRKIVIEEKEIKPYDDYTERNAEAVALKDVLECINYHFIPGEEEHQKRVGIFLYPGEHYPITKFQDKKNLEQIQIWKREE